MVRSPGAAGGLPRTLSLLALFGATFGCPRRAPEAVPEAATSAPVEAFAEATSPAEASARAPADAASLLESALADASIGPREAAEESLSPCDGPETPVVPLRDRAALEQACRRRDWPACTALADRLADGPAEERDEERADGLYARACEQGRRGDACRRLGLRRLRAASTPATGREAVERLEQACAADYLDACATLGEVLVRGEQAPRDVYVGLQRLQHACLRGYAAACVATRGLREIAESYDLPLPRAVGPEPVKPGKEPPAEAVCPALFHGAAAVAVRERLDGGLARLAPAALATALPGAVEGWAVERTAVPDGDSFPRGTAVGARFVAGDGGVVNLVVRDRAAECTLQPGTGAAMLERTGRGVEGRSAVRVGAEPAVLFGPPGARTLVLWVADRCEVRATATGVSDERLRALAGALDLAALRRECGRREGDGGVPVYE